MIVASVMREFGAPTFLLWTTIYKNCIIALSLLVAGPRGAGKSEFVKQLISLKRYIMTDPPERIVWFYGRHQPDLLCSLTQEIPRTEFYEGLPMNIEVMFDRCKRNICIIDDLMQSASGNQLVENVFTNGRHLNLSVVFVSQLILYRKEMQNHLFEFNLHRGFQESKRSNPNSSSSMSDVPIQTKFLQAAYEEETKDPYRYLFLDFHPNSAEFARVRGHIFPYDLLKDPCCLYLPKDIQI